MKKILPILCVFGFEALNAQTIPSYVPSQSLKLWMPFNNNYDDQSGNNNNATNFGTVFTQDRCNNNNQAVYFDGNYRKLIIQNSILPSTATSFSIAFWAKRNPVNGTGRDIIADRSTDPSYRHKYRILLGSRNSFAPMNYSHNFILFGSQGEQILKSDSVETSDWEHIVVIYNHQSLQQFIYSNGVQLDSRSVAANSYPQETNSTWIGGIDIPPGGPSNLDFPYQGSLDDIGMWSRALEMKEIVTLYGGSCNTTSIKNVFNNNLIEIYPNPAKSNITIENKVFKGEKFSVKLINNLGQEVLRQYVESAKADINLGNTNAPGVYYVYLINKNNQVISVREISLK